MTGPTPPWSGWRCLWLAAELPARLDTGLKVYSLGLAGSVAGAGVAVTMVGFGQPGPVVNGLTYAPVGGQLRGGWRSLTSGLPNLSYAASGPAMRQRILALLGEPWDLIVVDHLQMAWALTDPDVARGIGATGAPVVFVAHNHEASVRRAAAASEPWWHPKRLLLTLDAAKAAWLEGRAVRRSNVLTAITADDAARFAAGSGRRTPVVTVSPGYDDPGASPPAMAERPRRVVVLGSFQWHVKATNLRRMVEAMAGPLTAAGIELVIGGSMPEGLAEQLARRGVRSVGWVEDIGGFLATGRIGLIVEPLGGGFKLKSLDYVFHQLVVAALEGSAAGLPAEVGRCFITDTDPERLAANVVALIDRTDELEARAERALAAAARAFRWSDRAAAVLEAAGRATHSSAQGHG